MLVSNLGMVFLNMQMSVWLASFYNVLRCLAIGCLMMPLVTWGISGIKEELTAHGTALLTSLRTIAGAVGSAVFVGIMTVAAQGSVADYGANAQIHGLNVTFACMSVVTAILLAIAVFLVKEKKEKQV